ncbi:MAG TPA: metallophosphoesterase [Phycisphaerae bacterium]|nr:metallophosphoesterase [Phycisphaerae bacterium]
MGDRPTRRSFIRRTGAALLTALGVGRGAPAFARGADAQPPAGEPAAATQEARPLLATPEALFRPTATGCTVQWVPEGVVEARVMAGSEPGRLELVSESTSAEPSEVEIGGFAPDSEIHLQCWFRRQGDRDWVKRPVRRVHSARAPGSTYRIALIADSHQYAFGEHSGAKKNLGQTITAVLADRPDFVVFLGDEAGIHHLKDRRRSLSRESADFRWASWRLAFAPLLAAVPSCIALGNHEGEAGFYQHVPRRHGSAYLQRWGTIARKRYCRNPSFATYPEGGENENWIGDQDSPATGGAADGNCSPLENYYAWTWGDALFVVLDVHRYTNIGGLRPNVVEQWTLGKAQLQWFERVLTGSRARWKFVVAHHLVGGYAWDLDGTSRATDYVYGRGGARYARVGEQDRITQIMKQVGAQFFLYGHDHMFAHRQAEGIHFVCCGRPTWLSAAWWETPGWREAYGDAAARDPHDFYGAIGYTRLTVGPDEARIQYLRTATDPKGTENVSTPVGQVVHEFAVS